MYSLVLENNSLCLKYDNEVIMKNIVLTPSVTRQRAPFTLVPKEIEKIESGYSVSFVREPDWGGCDEVLNAHLNFNITDDSLIININIETTNADCMRYYYTFNPYNSIKINYEWGDFKKSLNLSNYLTPYWLQPSFNNNEQYNIAAISMDYGFTNGFFMVVPNDSIMPDFTKEGVSIHTNLSGVTKINATVMGISFNKNIYSAIENCIMNLKQHNDFVVSLKEGKELPEKLNGFGWCTWDAFYKDVSEEGIINKLEEFKSKNIKLKWFLIDDGWFIYNENKQLCSFKEDKNKFPSGLKGLISIAKEKYGVEYVGVWHAFSGYWKGIAKHSEIENKYSDFLFYGPSGEILPGETYEKAYNFWDTWHSYLKEQGVDFVKVDNQGVVGNRYDNVYSGTEGLRIQHKALEDSVAKNFGGTIINCMGSNINNILNRTYSCLNRNSDDYYPNRENHFSTHAPANLYVTPLQRCFYICDFDMFWTDHREALEGAVLRAISGGPIYVSDKVGCTKSEILSHLFDKDGTIPLFDDAAIPTLDCYYVDCKKEKVPLKAFNRKNDNIVIGAFNISPDDIVKGKFSLNNIPDTLDRYYVHDFFKDEYFILNKEDVYQIELEPHKCALLTLYPIVDGESKIGDKKLFAEGASNETTIVRVK